MGRPAEPNTSWFALTLLNYISSFVCVNAFIQREQTYLFTADPGLPAITLQFTFICMLTTIITMRATSPYVSS